MKCERGYAHGLVTDIQEGLTVTRSSHLNPIDCAMQACRRVSVQGQNKDPAMFLNKHSFPNRLGWLIKTVVGNHFPNSLSRHGYEPLCLAIHSSSFLGLVQTRTDTPGPSLLTTGSFDGFIIPRPISKHPITDRRWRRHAPADIYPAISKAAHHSPPSPMASGQPLVNNGSMV